MRYAYSSRLRRYCIRFHTSIEHVASVEKQFESDMLQRLHKDIVLRFSKAHFLIMQKYIRIIWYDLLRQYCLPLHHNQYRQYRHRLILSHRYHHHYQVHPEKIVPWKNFSTNLLMMKILLLLLPPFMHKVKENPQGLSTLSMTVILTTPEIEIQLYIYLNKNVLVTRQY